MTNTTTKTNWLNVTLACLNIIIWAYVIKFGIEELLSAFQTFDRITGYMP